MQDIEFTAKPFQQQTTGPLDFLGLGTHRQNFRQQIVQRYQSEKGCRLQRTIPLRTCGQCFHAMQHPQGQRFAAHRTNA